MLEKYKQHTLSPVGTTVVRLLKNSASDLDACMTRNIPNSRELSLAITRLEEAVMWATKAIALYGIRED